MTPTTRFALERHPGPYATWPARTRLLADGAPTEILLQGYDLLHQWEVPGGYLLVADHECPHEEATTFALLSPALRLLATKTLGGTYASYLLEDVAWEDAHTLLARFHGGDRFRVEVRPDGIPFFRPRLRVKKVR